jgi:hypothetical protein
MARELGVSEPEVVGLIEALERDKRVVRDGDRLIVVEPAAAPYDPGELPI